MNARIILIILVSISIWFNFNLSKMSQESAYSAGHEAAMLENFKAEHLVKIHPRANIDIGNILLVANTIFTQLLLLTLFFLLVKKAPNKKRNEMDGSVEPPIR